MAKKVESKQESTRDKLTELRDKINKSYDTPVMSFGDEQEIVKQKIGVLSIDVEAGGMPRGRWIILVGNESTCKSTILYKSGGAFQRRCGNCFQGMVKEINFKPVKAVDPSKPDNVNCRYRKDAEGKKVVDEFGEPIVESLKYFANKDKKNVYCPGQKIIHKKPFTLYSYELECSECSDPMYSIFLLIDSEKNYTRSWARKHNVVHYYVLIAGTTYSEQTGEIVRDGIGSGRVSFVGIDSVAAQGPMVELNSSFEDQQMGVQARTWNKIVRVLTSKLNSVNVYKWTNKEGKQIIQKKRSEPALVVIQQWREKIGGYGGKDMGAGRGLKFASSLTYSFSRVSVDWESKEDKTVKGIWYGWEMLKGKVGKSMRVGRFYFDLEKEDIVDEQSIVEYAIKQGVVTVSGSWYEYKKTGQKFQGVQNFIAWLDKNPKIKDTIYKEILHSADRT